MSASRIHAVQRPLSLDADVCVIGAGSAGVAAAVAAGRDGARTALVERWPLLGGTATNAMVSNWEPGPGCSLALELYRRMEALGGAGVARSYPVQTKAPMGFLLVTPGLPYENTLVRALPEDRSRQRVPYSVPFQPRAFDAAARQMLAATGRVQILAGHVFREAAVNAAGTRIASILATDPSGGSVRLRAKVFIDASGDIELARALGCEVMLGTDPRSRFDEPSAPAEASLQLNAITRCYTVVPSPSPRRAPPPEVDVAFPHAAFVTGWRDGERSVNMMPTLPGRALIDLGYEACMERSEAIVRAHWHWLQEMPEFREFELAAIAPMLGIRESWRLVARHVLTEHDVVAGLPCQHHADVIAVADHPCDVHGAGGHLTPVNTAYGVPYRCLLPAGVWENLLVACRGAGFSKIAASSVRLQRTMMQLGHAAGMAAAMAAHSRRAVDHIDVEALVRRLDVRSRYPFQRSWVMSCSQAPPPA